jgi:hypothetical protein
MSFSVPDLAASPIANAIRHPPSAIRSLAPLSDARAPLRCAPLPTPTCCRLAPRPPLRSFLRKLRYHILSDGAQKTSTGVRCVPGEGKGHRDDRFLSQHLQPSPIRSRGSRVRKYDPWFPQFHVPHQRSSHCPEGTPQLLEQRTDRSLRCAFLPLALALVYFPSLELLSWPLGHRLALPCPALPCPATCPCLVRMLPPPRPPHGDLAPPPRRRASAE